MTKKFLILFTILFTIFNGVSCKIFLGTEVEPTQTPSPTNTVVPAPTLTNTPTPTITPAPTSTFTPTPTPTFTPTLTPTTIPTVVSTFPPVVSLTADKTTIENNESITFTAVATDQDGDSITYEWYINDVKQECVDSNFTFSQTSTAEENSTVKVIVSDGFYTAFAEKKYTLLHPLFGTWENDIETLYFQTPDKLKVVKKDGSATYDFLISISEGSFDFSADNFATTYTYLYYIDNYLHISMDGASEVVYSRIINQ